MRKEYEYYYYEKEINSKPLIDKTEMEIEARDPEKMSYIILKGVIHKDSENYPDADLLWLRTERGLEKDPWAIEVQEMTSDEEQIEAESRPHVRIAYGGKKGRMLADMLKERQEERKKDN
jgi:hypothetical protein